MSSKTATSVSSSSTTESARKEPSLSAESISKSPSPAGRGQGEGARCSHFGDCGGCQIQNLEYSQQLAQKSAGVQELLKPIGWEKDVPVHPSPQMWYYRNKMEFSFQDVYPVPPAGEDYLKLGLKRKERWDKVLNLSECHLMSPETPELLKSVHDWARKLGLEPYNLHRQTGFLRHLVVREGKNTSDRMVLLLTNPGELPKESFVSAVMESYPATTILWGINGKKADVAKSEKLQILTGPGHITDKLLNKRMRISPFSFFQTNTRGAEALYTLIRSWLQETSPKNVLDLYCGSGGISLSVADLAARVMGIEVIDSAVDDARHNAIENKVSNTEFVSASVENLLPALAAQNLEVDAAVVDPPRSGLHPKALAALKNLAPRWLLYVSCNPKALAEDLRLLSSFYDIQRVEAVDLFPHTHHIETMALLRSGY